MANRIDIRDTIRFPRQEVFETYRDRLPELAAYLPNIDLITVESRTEREDGRIELLNLWKAARGEVPAVARPFVKPDMLQWHDHALWDNTAFTCAWRTEPFFLKDAVSSTGTNHFRDLGDDTMELHLTGTIEVDGAKLPGVPRLMSRKVASAVESFVVKMMEPNLRAINRGLEKFIADHRRA